MSSTPSSLNTILPSVKPYLIKAGWVKREPAPVFSAESSPPDLCTDAVGPSRTEDYGLQGRKISLDPTVRLKVEKLEMALSYLGIKPMEDQQLCLRQELEIDNKGTVSFGDFVQVARKVLHLQLDEVGIGQGPMVFGAGEIANLLDSHSSQPCEFLESKDFERLVSERNEAFKEINELKKQLCDSERHRKQLSEELRKVKQEAKAAVEETKALRSRIHLAEATQRQAQGMEQDYEEVIHLLEAEITELKAQPADRSGHAKDSGQDLRKRVTVLDCQLRKSEAVRKTLEVSTEKLLQFVEIVHEMLLDTSASLSNISDRRSMSSSQSLLTGLGRNDRNITAALSAEAKDLAKSVRSILEVDCLPYGWEEAYTADGIKYFINHVTQTTSWIHPVTRALSTSYSEENGEDPDEPPEP